jgi:hypothetical protein
MKAMHHGDVLPVLLALECPPHDAKLGTAVAFARYRFKLTDLHIRETVSPQTGELVDIDYFHTSSFQTLKIFPINFNNITWFQVDFSPAIGVVIPHQLEMVKHPTVR